MIFFRLRRAAFLAVLGLGPNVATAQTFTNLIFFGDSNTDNGRYKYVQQNKNQPSSYHAWGYTTKPGLMWSENLGLRFGFSVTPSAAPGGGNNYAAGGARVLHSNPLKNQWSATEQVAAYLASVGGVADPRALYTVLIGTNDLTTTTEAGSLGPGDYGNIVDPANNAALIDLGKRTAALVTQLYAAGARNFLLPNLYGSSGSIADARALYSGTIWQTVAAERINFVPADIRSVVTYVRANAAVFGFKSVSSNAPACGQVISVDCTQANWVAPDADQTYLYADTIGHLASGGQKIESDYYYSLLAAPSQMSYLAEAEIKKRLSLIAGLREQIAVSLARAGGAGLWITGDLQGLRLQNAPYPDQSGNPSTLAVGLDVRADGGILFGASVAYGRSRQVLGQGGGSFSTDGLTGSLYAAYRDGAVWADVIASAGAQSIATDRRVALGIATFSNTARTSGHGLSLAAEAGYDLSLSPGEDGAILKHGPVVGLVSQREMVDDFTEAASNSAPTALSFAAQTRRSLTTELGYRVSLTLGPWEPFARATWNHELVGSSRTVRAALTSTVAPSYALPAATPGRDYAALGLGARYALSERVRGTMSVSGQTGQPRAKALGVQLGLSMSID